MQNPIVWQNLILLIILSLSACATKPAVTTTSSSFPSQETISSQTISNPVIPSKTSTPLIFPTLTISPTASNSPTLTETNTPLPFSTYAPIPTATRSEITEWTTYVLTNGVTVDYPTGWTVELIPTAVYFNPPIMRNPYDNYSNVILEVHHLSLQDRRIADPHSWEPNEGGYEVLWEKPISIDSAEGLEFVWGEVHDNLGETAPMLHAIYYSKRYELDISIFTGFDQRSISSIQEIGFTDTISSRFGVFEHMVQSVRIDR
jgi:hypothetical protein